MGKGKKTILSSTKKQQRSKKSHLKLTMIHNKTKEGRKGGGFIRVGAPPSPHVPVLSLCRNTFKSNTSIYLSTFTIRQHPHLGLFIIILVTILPIPKFQAFILLWHNLKQLTKCMVIQIPQIQKFNMEKRTSFSPIRKV